MSQNQGEGVVEMVQGVKAPVTKLIMGLIPETHTVDEKNNSHKLCSDFHMYMVVHIHTYMCMRNFFSKKIKM